MVLYDLVCPLMRIVIFGLQFLLNGVREDQKIVHWLLLGVVKKVSKQSADQSF